MFLAVDIGNSSTSFAVFHRAKMGTFFYCDSHKLIDQKYLKKYFHKHLSQKTISACAISSVVPKITVPFKKNIRKILRNLSCIEVSSRIKTGLSFRVDNPLEVGADRIANCAAAHHLFKKDTIIVDFGTATTFDVLTKKGVYMGGLIYPGIETAFENLFHKAAKLRTIKLKKPKSLIGKNTTDHIRSGFFYGYGSVVDGIVKKIEAQTKKKFLVIGTGGFSPIIKKSTTSINKVDTYLTLKGIQIIASLNNLPIY